MKTQAWGWLAPAVLAAGLNSSYHNGGLQWAHEIADRVQHNTGAVLALATGRADQFLSEARMLKVDRAADNDADVDVADKTDVADNDSSQCPFSTAIAKVQTRFDQSRAEFDHFQAVSDRQQARLVRFEARRTQIEHEVRNRLAHIRIRTTGFNPVEIETPNVECPRVRVRMPRMPRIEVPTPDVHVDYSGPGPV